MIVSALGSVKAVVNVFRFVDDYLALLNLEGDGAVIEETSTIFLDSGSVLVFPAEVLVSGRLRFLDLKLEIGPEHSCWLYSPRAQTGPLTCDSAHSTILKRAFALSCLGAWVKK